MEDKSKIWAIADGCGYGVYYTVAAETEQEARNVFRTEIWDNEGQKSRYDYCKSSDAYAKCQNGDCPSCPHLRIEENGRSMCHENC